MYGCQNGNARNDNAMNHKVAVANEMKKELIDDLIKKYVRYEFEPAIYTIIEDDEPYVMLIDSMIKCDDYCLKRNWLRWYIKKEIGFLKDEKDHHLNNDKTRSWSDDKENRLNELTNQYSFLN